MTNLRGVLVQNGPKKGSKNDPFLDQKTAKNPVFDPFFGQKWVKKWSKNGQKRVKFELKEGKFGPRGSKKGVKKGSKIGSKMDPFFDHFWTLKSPSLSSNWPIFGVKKGVKNDPKIATETSF